MTGKCFRWLMVLALIVGVALTVPLNGYASQRPKLELTEEEENYIQTHGSLKVGYVQDRIPVSFRDQNGELAGISRSIFDRVSQLSGLKFEYAPLPAGEVTYDYLLGEQFDLVTSVEYNRENKKANGILISDPYLSSRKVVVAHEDLNFSVDAHLSVAISTGSQTIRKVLNGIYPNFELEDYDSISDCFDAVAHGKTDLMIQNQYVVEYWISKPAYEGLKVIPVLDMDDQLCFSAVVSFDGSPGPAQEDGQILISILDKAIALLTEDEVSNYTIQAVMENQYEMTFADFIYRYRYATGVLIISAVIITALAVLLIRQRVRSMQDRADAKAKGQFLSTMSHEIRTPLNGLIGLNYLMSQKLDDRERLESYLNQATATTNYLLALVNDILDMAELQDHKMELVQHTIDLNLLIVTVSSIVRSDMHDHGLHFEVQADITHPYILGDEMRIQQVLMNLLDNACKFTPEGGTVELRVEQSLLPDGSVLTQAEVRDTGKGMSEEFQKQVFHTFARELETVSKGNQGTGLGLSISRHLARAMGGDLTFTSQKGVGSCFSFTFQGQPMPVLHPHGKTSQIDKPRVLVAEDNELNREIMLELLDSEDFSVVLAENGREALELFERSEPGTFGVILMDLLMPEMDGFQAAQAIRALDRPDAKRVRIIACTANSFEEDRRKARESGMNDFVAKPVNIDELLEKLMDKR